MTSGFWLGATLTPFLFSDIALAQVIVPDDTLGMEQSAVSTGATANDFVIDGGAQRNTALFHSFKQFSINSNQTVFFENPASVDNIITRVTGGLPSNIDGLLGVDGPANLFLANPSGIIFGPNAQLDVAGAFMATTADQFLFANGTSFNAVNPNAPPLLTISVPLGVKFGANPQPISVNGATLRAGVGEPLVLLGGDVALNDANILAPGGHVGLSGLSQPGTISFNLDATSPQSFLTVPPLGQTNLSLNNSNINTVSEGSGDIVLQAQNISFIETTLLAGLNEDVDSFDTQGGSILVKGTGDIQLSGSIIQTFVEENGQGGDIHMNATNRLFLSGESEISSLAEGFESDAGAIFINTPDIRLNSGSRIASVTQASGGDINLTTHSLLVRQNSDIATTKFGPNTSDGNIRIRANNILIDDRGGDRNRPPIGITADVSFIPQDLGLPPEMIGGTGGNIEIDTQNLTLIGGLIGSTVFGNAQGGNLTIRARDTVRLVGDPAAARDNFAGIADVSTAIRDATLEGVSGDLRIDARHLILANGSTIDAGAFGFGNSGDILINTTESVTLQGTLNGQPSRIITQLQNSGPFDGGNIDLVTGRLTLQDGGQISASTIAESEGNGRDVSIIANQGIFITGSSPRIELPPGNADSPFVLDPTGTRFPSGIFASSPGEGNAGNVDIFSPNITVSNGAQISVSSTNAGAAGSLFIRGNNVVLDNAALLAEAVEGNLANIELSVRDSLQLLNGSRISTVARGDADGSNIIISGTDTQLLRFLIFKGGSTISTENSGRFGNGGDIDIAAQFILAFPGELNQIIANAVEGDGGEINIFTNAIFGRQFLNISASSKLGVNGDTIIETIETDPTNSLTQLPENVLDNSTQVADACAVPRSGQSQFIVTGRGGLPLMPSSRPVGRYLLSDLRTQAPQDGKQVLQEAKQLVVTARGDYYLQGESSRSLPQLLEAARQEYQQAKYPEAITYWTQAVNQLSKSKHPGAYASVQSHLALAYHHLGDWDKAREAMAASQAVLTPELIAQQPALHAQVLNTRASLFLTRGNIQAALEDWQQAAAVYQRAGDDLGNLQAQLNQIQVLQDLGYLRQTQQRLVQLMQPLEQQPPSPVKAIGQLNLGKVSRAEGNLLRSQRQLEAALTTAQSLNQLALTSTILLNLGHTFRGQGNTQKALGYYQQAREIAPTSLIQFQVQVSRYDLLVVQKDPAASTIFQELQVQAQQLPSSREGIYAQLHLIETVLDSKLDESQALLNLLSRIQAQAQELDDPNAQSYILGYQGRIYGQAQQWSQALSLTEQALQRVQRQQAPEVLYQLAWQLGRYRRQLGNRQGAISAYLDAVAALRSLRGDLSTASDDVRFTFRDGVEPVYRELVALLLEGDMNQTEASSNLTQARKLIEDLQLNEIQDYFQDACVQAQPLAADQVDPKAAVIYPIVLKDRVDVIVSIGNQPLRHYSTPIEPGQVDTTVNQLLRSLTTPLGSVQKNNLTKLKLIYDWVIDPASADLAQQDIETLVFVADGALRTLPLTTLYDGEQYLIEKYNVALSPGLELLAPRSQDRERVKLLVGGVSEARSGFPALPFVAKEVEQITAQIQDNDVLLNQDLTRDNLNDYLTEVSSEVVHLATHAEFGASPEDTFILTWEGKLSIQAMASLLRSRSLMSEVPIDLLVLSACETATGNSRAVLGIAGMAIRSGVRSTLAGLWSLDDQAAAAFMGHFYQALAQPNTTKASAFRQAQLALMKNPKFRAPYFWSPFVLVGNWL
ncbi:CHAT domain-containing protein [Acaryochloris marina]|uniref:Haemagglutination activity domain protein n=1 Tax=Acaryochloris marina (strain MBIC 11017) TaxID=329726 RepID=A8ZKU3_ACAM1|nr:CHAT domain-containing protein [Acaryochloris marina]ABW31411.1 haemagglutination activity domain protein [Acaryochloris marina MBIC11017]